MNFFSRVADSKGPLEIEGYLRKMQIKNRDVHKQITKLKYFKISSRDRGKFCYSNHKSIHSWRREISFDEFIKFIPNLDHSHRSLCEYEYGFQLKTKQKNYVLFCEEEIFHYDWIRLLEYIINKRELTYDHYEKYVQIKECQSDFFHSIKSNEKDDNSYHKKSEFSFRNNTSKKYENVLDESTNKNEKLNTETDYETFKQKTSNKLSKKNTNKESTNIVEYNKFKMLNKDKEVCGENNENCPIDWNYVFQPKYVDISTSKPINELRKYKILNSQDEIKSKNEDSKYKLKSKINFHDNISFIDAVEERVDLIFIGANSDENSENVTKNRTKKEKAYCDREGINQRSIDCFVDKGEIKDLINFNYENIYKKQRKSKSDRLSRLPNSRSISYRGGDNDFEIFKDLFEDNDSYQPNSSKSAQDHFDVNNNVNNSEKRYENIIPNSKIFKSMNSFPVESNYLETLSTGENSEKTKYVHKKISVSNKSLNNINFNSRHSSKNSKDTKEIYNLGGIYTSSNRSFTTGRNDLVFESVNTNEQKNHKKDQIFTEILNLVEDDLSENLADIHNPSIGSDPKNNFSKVVVKYDKQFNGKKIKNNEASATKLNHENSLIFLKNMKKAPTNNNIITDESLVEQGSQWVMNLKIIKNEKF